MSMGGLSASEHRLERLRTLTEVSRALTYTTSTAQVLSLTVERAAELMSADKALIMLADEEGLLSVRAAHGVDEARVNELREPLSETLVRRLQALLDYPDEECFLGVPLVVQGQVTGLLAAVRSAGAAGSEDDEWLLSALSDQAAVALENARLAGAVREERDERSRLARTQGRAHATLGHELRSPLTAIESYTTLLLDGLFGPLNDRQRESIARIQMSGQHLLAVIENVMDMTRLNAGVLPLSCVDVPVANVLDDAVHMLQPLAARKHQQLRVGQTSMLAVRADPNRLRQVLVNLIDNAIKYTPARGTIALQVAATERAGRPFVGIAVTDNGPGIAGDASARVFEPYERGGAGAYEPGLGLGLYISRELVRQMGGDIELQSEPGHGSTFTALLPPAGD